MPRQQTKIQLYSELGLAYFDMDISEVEDELETYKRLKRWQHDSNFRYNSVDITC